MLALNLISWETSEGKVSPETTTWDRISMDNPSSVLQRLLLSRVCIFLKSSISASMMYLSFRGMHVIGEFVDAPWQKHTESS